MLVPNTATSCKALSRSLSRIVARIQRLSGPRGYCGLIGAVREARRVRKANESNESKKAKVNEVTDKRTVEDACSSPNSPHFRYPLLPCLSSGFPSILPPFPLPLLFSHLACS